MTTAPGTVYLVDDDDAFRDATRWLLEGEGLSVVCYATADEFLSGYAPAAPGCLVLDIRMPGMSGLELQDELRSRDAFLPILFVTGHGEVPMAVEAIKKGAVDFIEKPFDGRRFLNLVEQALLYDAALREQRASEATLSARLATLTLRERQVMDGVIAGKSNKRIADELRISVKTVEAHRGHVMDKLETKTVPDLVRLAVAFEAARQSS
jgi:FixJ family two-component response regulator